MPESKIEIEVRILNELREVVLDIKPSTKDDVDKMESEINHITRNALYETSEDMRNFEKCIELLES